MDDISNWVESDLFFMKRKKNGEMIKKVLGKYEFVLELC